MSRYRTVGLALTAAAAVLTLGVIVAPAGASDTVQPVTASATATPTSPGPSTTPPPPPGEGCTPGFWKTHPDAWGGTAYSPTATLGSVFTGLPAAYANVTLLQALSFKGGGLEALLRQAVAALLNSTNAEVSYPLTADEIIALVNAALVSGDYESLKDQLDAANNLGAPGFCD
jgi:hypothetical protein